MRKGERLLQRKAIRALESQTSEADQLAVELLDCARIVAEAWLIASGHHQHSGSWRKKRGEKKAESRISGVGTVAAK
jgi:hypothetical protein